MGWGLGFRIRVRVRKRVRVRLRVRLRVSPHALSAPTPSVVHTEGLRGAGLEGESGLG